MCQHITISYGLKLLQLDRAKDAPVPPLLYSCTEFWIEFGCTELMVNMLSTDE